MIRRTQTKTHAGFEPFNPNVYDYKLNIGLMLDIS